MRTLSVLVATFLVMLIPATASADEAVVEDAVDDVYGSIAEGFEQVEPVGTRPNTDLRRTVVEHRAHALVVKVRYEEVVPGASSSMTYEASILYRTETYRDLADMQVEIAPSLRKATVRLYVDFDGHEPDCPRPTAEVKPAKDKLVVRVPRTCLDDPEWIRYGAEARSFDKEDRAYYDRDNGSDFTGGPRTEKLYAG